MPQPPLLYSVTVISESKAPSPNPNPPFPYHVFPRLVFCMVKNKTVKKRQHPSTGGRQEAMSASAAGRNLLSANKALGQNFLKNPAIVNSIVEKAGNERR